MERKDTTAFINAYLEDPARIKSSVMTLFISHPEHGKTLTEGLRYITSIEKASIDAARKQDAKGVAAGVLREEYMVTEETDNLNRINLWLSSP